MAKTKPLLEFAKYLKEARHKAKLTQAEVISRLATTSYGKVSQSMIAQIELGKVSNPSRELLQALAEIYNLDYGEVVYSWSIDFEKYGGLYKNHPEAPALMYVASKRHPVFAGVEGLEVVCKFTKEYNMPPMLVGDDILEWALKYPALGLIWMWTPHFSHHHSDGQSLNQAVQKLVQTGTKVVFFVDKKESERSGNFWLWHQRMMYGFGMSELFQAKTVVVPVPEEAGVWNFSDVMLANPHTGPTHGVLVHSNLGIEIYQPELTNNMRVMLTCADLSDKTKEVFL